ncbi:MAG: aminotransferase class I/II-fold pyridoxal phosphate-dependent enzyme [Polyangiaceae bacterium]
MERIYLSVPHMEGTELSFVQQAFDSNWLSSVGPNLDAFEAQFSELVGKPCVALASGTAAIHLGLRLLGVGPGDEVVCPTLTFVASASPIRYLGATPVFVDSEATSWNMDPDLLRELLTQRASAGKLPRAIVVVHLFGQMADMDAIRAAAAEYAVPVLEDAAEALGADYRGSPAGSLAEVGAFSFNGNKIITTTGGGMLCVPDEECAARVRFWSTQAREPGVAYSHRQLGYNYRMSNVLAGIGRGQLSVLPARVASRRAVFQRYVHAFRNLAGMRPMPEADWGTHTRWLSCFTVDQAQLGCSRQQLIDFLAECSIEARPVWKPMHQQPLFEGAECWRGEVADGLFRDGICLPSSSNLGAAQERVIEAVLDAVAAHRDLGASCVHG